MACYLISNLKKQIADSRFVSSNYRAMSQRSALCQQEKHEPGLKSKLSSSKHDWHGQLNPEIAPKPFPNID